VTEQAKQPESDEARRSILINFVLDKSGSMEAIREATISGFNEFKNDQASEDGEAFFTLTLFDTEFSTVCQAVPMREVADLDHRTYAPSGMTALYDAIGHTMRITDDFVAANRPDQVLFVIMTDGEENSSREFSRDRIFQMIQDRQKLAQYEFIYLGANQDSYMAGRGMGLRDGRMLDYAATPEGSRDAMLRASHNVRAHRRKGMPMSPQFFSDEMDGLGAIDAAAWKAMSSDERKRHLEGDDQAQQGAQ
jgi:uncharacterized protein YegL